MSATLLNNIEGALGALGSGAGSAPVSLGGITFVGVEIPSQIERGSGQAMAMHRLPGGARIINVLGADPARRTISGIFAGPGAMQRVAAVEALQGTAVALSYLGITEQVLVVSITSTLADRGAVVRFTVECDPLPVAAISSGSSDLLSSLIGPDTAASIQSVANTVGSAAAYVAHVAVAGQQILGEITPIASIVGLGGPLSMLSQDMTAVGTFSAAATGIGAAPTALATLGTSVAQAGADCSTAVAAASGSLLGIGNAAANGIASDGPSLQAAVAHAGVLAGSVQAGGYLNATLAGIAARSGAAQPLPVVHS